MIVKLFHQGQRNADYIVNYLLSDDKHKDYKPEIVEGDAELIKSVINSINSKHKYVTGVISFRHGEQLTKVQQHELIERFENTFCPFSDRARSSFLWVKHFDKGRLELHWVNARTDLRTGKSFNLHPPGKANQLFFEAFVRIENMRNGFEQVDGKKMTAKDAKFYSDVLVDLYTKRKEYLINKYDRPRTTIRKGSNYGRESHFSRSNAKYTQSRDIADGYKFKAHTGGSFQQPADTSTNRHERSTNEAYEDKSAISGPSKLGSSSLRISEDSQPDKDYSKYAYDSTKGILELMRTRPTEALGMSVDDELYALGLQLNTCDLSETSAINARLHYLQGLKSRQDKINKAEFGKTKLKIK